MNVPSTATAALKQLSGTPAAALAEPSTGSTTSVSAEPRSSQPRSSERRFTPNRAVAAMTASSTSTSMSMVGVPSAPTNTVAASSACSWSLRAAR